MTTDKKTPVTAPTVNEGTKSIPERSVTTAYLADFEGNTRDTYGTWSGESLPMKGHITIIVPIRTARLMHADGPQLIGLNHACVVAQSAEVRKAREEREEKERQRIRRELSDRITEEEGFEEQLAALDAQATEIYAQIDAKVDAILEKEGKQ